MKWLLLFGMALAIYLVGAGALRADEGWRLLFHSLTEALPAQDQQAIYAQMGLAISADGRYLLVPDVEAAGPVTIKASRQDLNGDGQDEIFLLGGNAYLSGGTGSSIWLFIKSATDQTWRMHLGFPAAAYTVLDERNAGFPDLRFGGMGWCDGIWRWDGSGYAHHRNVATAPGGCDHLARPRSLR
ncbi:MAG: hypothetical protein HND59_04895 [Pseudomonadota bacterium]|nr:MAG: hypothetical protein HND59_04895 [Pseudomonadota bacterium]